MKIKLINNYRTDENTYIVYENNNAVIIDPGIGAERIKEECKKLGLNIGCVLLTHCHYDHIEGLEELAKDGVEVIASEKCAVNVNDPDINLSVHGFGYGIENIPIAGRLKDNEEFEACGIVIKCIHTPGHTNGSACFLIGNSLFSGDTLFWQSVGRTDLPTGNSDMLNDSIKNKLYKLPEDITVYPGHGKSTTIGCEKKYNFFVTE